MATHISHASLPYPIKNARYTMLTPYLDADGDPTDPTTPDTEVSQDGAAFADAAEEVTTISGSNGMGYFTLSGAETNNSAVGIAFKVASGPKPTLATLYPRNLPILASGTASAGAAGSITLASSITYDITGCFVRTTGGTGGGGTGGANNQARRITAYNTSTQVATVTPNWETTPDNTTTYDILCPEGVTPGMLKALNPTAAGRTLDVSSGGEAGLDWANVGTPGSTVNLSATTINVVNTASALTTNNDKTGYALSAAGVDAIWDEPLAAHTTADTPGQVLNMLTQDSVTLSSDVALGSIVGQLLDAGSSWSYDRATDSLEAIRDRGDAAWTTATGFSTLTQADVRTAVGLASANLDTQLSGIQSDTDNIQTRLPVALVGGRMDSNVQAMANDVITAAACADGFIDRASFAADTGLQSIRSNTAQAGAAGTVTLDASASATDDFYNDCDVLLTGGTGAGQVRHISDYVGSTKVATIKPSWATNPDTTSTFALLPRTSPWDQVTADHLDSGSTGSSLNAAGSAGDPWATALPGAYGAGTAGRLVGRSLPDIVAGAAGGLLIAGSNAATTFATLTITGAMSINGTGNVAQTGDNFARLGAPAGASVSADIAGVQSDTNDIQTRLPAALVGGRMDSNVQATAASLTFNLTGNITGNLSGSVGSVTGAVGSVTAGVTVTTNNDKTGYSLAVAPPTAAAISTAVWSEAIPGSFGAGTAGAKLNSAASAGDPWGTALPGAYGAGTAGFILGTNLNATVSSRSSHSAADVWAVGTRTLTAFSFSVTVGTNSDKTGYTLTSAERDAVADALLVRSVSNVQASATEHSLCTVILAGLESSRSGNTLTIYRTDGSTVYLTKTLTSDSAAVPITGIS